MQIGPKLRWDSHTLGNLAKNLSPAAAFIPGLGLPATFALSALGDLGRGKNIGEAVVGGAKNVAIGAGARGLAGHFGALGQGGAPVAPGVPQVSSQGSGFGLPTTTVGSGADGAYGAASAVPGAVDAGGSSTLGKIGAGAGKALDWTERNPHTAAAVLGGLGNIGTMGTENRVQSAQAKLLEQQGQQDEYDYNRKKASDLAMEPLRQALYGRLGTMGTTSTAAPDPYQRGAV